MAFRSIIRGWTLRNTLDEHSSLGGHAYLVIDLHDDPLAIHALRHCASRCDESDPDRANELREWIRTMEREALAKNRMDRLSEYGGCIWAAQELQKGFAVFSNDSNGRVDIDRRLIFPGLCSMLTDMLEGNVDDCMLYGWQHATKSQLPMDKWHYCKEFLADKPVTLLELAKRC